MLAGVEFDRERMRGAASDELIAATDIADLLVRLGMPFREAHGVVAGLVRTAVDSGRALSELGSEELAAQSELLAGHEPEFRARARVRRSWLESKVSQGGTASARLRRADRAGRAGAGWSRSRLSSTTARCCEVAPELVGCTVVHGETAGVIVETEAYHEEEPACHAYVGLTPRTRTLFGPPGRAYVYRSYGIHALLNAVCEPEGVGAAVLIRALAPAAGLELMRGAARADATERELCSGPGRLTQALGIGLEENGTPLDGGPIVILPARGRRAPAVVAGAAGRDHEGGRAALALLRGRQPERVAAVALAGARRRRLA